MLLKNQDLKGHRFSEARFSSAFRRLRFPLKVCHPSEAGHSTGASFFADRLSDSDVLALLRHHPRRVPLAGRKPETGAPPSFSAAFYPGFLRRYLRRLNYCFVIRQFHHLNTRMFINISQFEDAEC